MEMEVGTHAALFPDRVQLCSTKSAEDLRNLMAARISQHQQAEQERLDAEREKIRKEEAARARKLAEEEARAKAQAEEAAKAEAAKAELAAAKASSGADLSPAAQALHEQEGAARPQHRPPPPRARW
ncbi:hypothetical protein G6F66_014590 [Rhizopus arrhizus]|nr:hypothetical protein G6F66_014590 [Rhizopus arrhizus]